MMLYVLKNAKLLHVFKKHKNCPACSEAQNVECITELHLTPIAHPV